jgi:hypothetical protein
MMSVNMEVAAYYEPSVASGSNASNIMLSQYGVTFE